MRRIYIGCSLTHSPQEFKDLVLNLKEKLKGEYEVFEFLGLEKGTATDVYHEDVGRCVARCDLFVAICDHSSLGLGYEMATALEKYSKPTLGLGHEDSNISRLVIGIDHPMYEFRRYKTLDEIILFIKEKELKHFKPVASAEICETDVCAV
ncbi:MAG: hypothetical protein HY507_02280 [Candidatus Zambryskibacteria bacterium]|nr:hypothetical protein [Candidatus Zambryskibacteria bacterium]